MSETSINIKFGSPQLEQDSSKISLIIHLQKHQIEKHYAEISQAITRYKIPLLVLEIPSQFRQLNFQLFSKFLGQEIRFQAVDGKDKKNYYLYQPKDLQIIGPLRKIQNLLQSLNTLNNSLYLNVVLCNFQATVDKKNDLAFSLFENLLLQGKIDLDKKFIKLFSQIVSKVSPGFDQSPLIAFIQLFGGAELDLQFESPSVLSNTTRQNALQQPFAMKELGEGKQDQILKLMLKSRQRMKAYVNVGKLGYIQMSAQARVWALLHCLI